MNTNQTNSTNSLGLSMSMGRWDWAAILLVTAVMAGYLLWKQREADAAMVRPEKLQEAVQAYVAEQYRDAVGKPVAELLQHRCEAQGAATRCALEARVKLGDGEWLSATGVMQAQDVRRADHKPPTLQVVPGIKPLGWGFWGAHDPSDATRRANRQPSPWLPFDISAPLFPPNSN